MRDKGESEEQSGFGSHCEEKKKNIYSVKAKGFQSMKAECKKKRMVKSWSVRNVRSARPNENIISIFGEQRRTRE